MMRSQLWEDQGELRVQAGGLRVGSDSGSFKKEVRSRCMCGLSGSCSPERKPGIRNRPAIDRLVASSQHHGKVVGIKFRLIKPERHRPPG